MKSNRYPLSMRDRLRYRCGLTWARHVPALGDIGRMTSVSAKDIAVLAFLIAAYALVGTLDYAEEQRAEAERQAVLAEAAHAILAQCMNGRARWTYENHSGKGYGKTAVICRPAEEIPI